MGLELEPATLAEFIDECVTADAERKRRADDRRTADGEQLEVLFNQAIADAKRKMTFVPFQLQPHIVFTGRRPKDAELRAGWIPRQFAVRAPGLEEITFTVAPARDLLALESITVDGKRFDTWIQAVARAHELHTSREVKRDGISEGI